MNKAVQADRPLYRLYMPPHPVDFGLATQFMVIELRSPVAWILPGAFALSFLVGANGCTCSLRLRRGRRLRP